jgi:hypothetical protein
MCLQRSARGVVGLFTILVAACGSSNLTAEVDVRSLVSRLGSEAVEERRPARRDSIGTLRAEAAAVPGSARDAASQDPE